MKKGSKKSLLVVVLLLLVGVTAYFAASTYAKYASQITGNQGTATVAKWNFSTENRAQSFTIDLAGTYDASTLVANKIAPGTEGAFQIALTNGTTETGVDFTVTLNSITNKPTNIVFYKERTGSAGAYSYSNELTPGTSTITGQIQAGDSTGVTIPIYWKWAYGTSNSVTDTVNEHDTTDGEAAKTLTIGLDVVGIQTEPGAHIDTHVN